MDARDTGKENRSYCLGFRVLGLMENLMEKDTENEMDTMIFCSGL